MYSTDRMYCRWFCIYTSTWCLQVLFAIHCGTVPEKGPYFEEEHFTDKAKLLTGLRLETKRLGMIWGFRNIDLVSREQWNVQWASKALLRKAKKKESEAENETITSRNLWKLFAVSVKTFHYLSDTEDLMRASRLTQHYWMSINFIWVILFL